MTRVARCRGAASINGDRAVGELDAETQGPVVCEKVNQLNSRIRRGRTQQRRKRGRKRAKQARNKAEQEGDDEERDRHRETMDEVSTSYPQASAFCS